jgi:uncharacterized membrane protein (DUF2068 family)
MARAKRLGREVKSNHNEAKEISKLVTGYKLALGIGEIVLGFGITIFGNKALSIYQSLKSYGLMEGSFNFLIRIADDAIPFIFQHKLAIVVVLLFIGFIESVSSTAILLNKNWGVHLLLALMLLLLPFDLFGMFRNFFTGHIGPGNVALNAINIWIIFSLTHNHPIQYLRRLRA